MQAKRFLVFVGFLILVPVQFLPIAAAVFSWTETYEEIIDPSVTTTSDGDGDSVGLGSVLIQGVQDGDSGDLYFYRCLVTTGDCTRVVIVEGTAGSVYDGWDITQVTRTDPNNVVACYGDENGGTGGGVFIRSSNGGQLWSSGVDTNLGHGCGTDAAGTKVWMAGVNMTGETAADDFQFVVSSNSGATFGSVFYGNFVGALEDGDDFDADVQVAAKNESHVMVLGGTVSSSIARCYSTTGGDVASEWTCDLPLSFSAFSNDFYYDDISGKFHGLATSNAGDTVTWYSFESVDGIPTQNTFATSETLASHAALYVVNATTFLAVWEAQTGTSDGHARFSMTTNGGVDWTTPENAITDENGVQATASPGVGVTFSNGKALVSYVHETATAETDDNVLLAATSDLGQLLESSATAAVTNLVGFDVDPTGSRVVASVGGGDETWIWPAKTLGTPDGTVSTNCDQDQYEDAVAAKHGGELVMFLKCHAVDGHGEFLSIRDPGGSIPSSDEFSGCTPGSTGDQCPYDITIGEPGWGAFDDVGQLGQIKDFPIDYSQQIGSLGAQGLAFAFSTQDNLNDAGAGGLLGVATFVHRQGAADGNEEDTVSYSANQVDDFCIGLDGTNYYLAGAAAAESVKTWPVSISEDSFPQADLEVTISGAQTFGVSGAAGIACGAGQVAFTTGTTLYYADRATGTVLDSVNIGNAVARGVAITDEFTAGSGAPCTDSLSSSTCHQFILAYEEDDDVVIVYDGHGGQLTETGRLTVTVDGSFQALEVDRVGNWAWVAQSGQIDGFEIFTITSGNETGIPCIINCGDGEGDTGDGLFSDSGATIGAALGTGAFGGNLFLGAVLMGLVAYGVGTGYGNAIDGDTMRPRALRVNPWAAAVGAVVGFLMAWGFGFFSTAVVFSLVALVAMIVGIRLWVSRG